MRSFEHGWVTIVFRVLAAIGLIYLILPILMMFPLSLEEGSILRFPPQKISLHWYGDYLANDAWIASTLLSFKVAFCASVIATIVGTLAAVGMKRAPPRVRSALNVILMSPIFLPTIVIAVALYGVFAALRLVGTPLALISSYATLTLPFVMLNVTTAMAASPQILEDAARSLGAGPFAVFTRITVPLLWRGIAAGAVFSFLVSFDEVVIAMFLSGTQAVTLPKRMIDGIFYELTPMLAAVSCLLVVLNGMLAAFGLAFARKR